MLCSNSIHSLYHTLHSSKYTPITCNYFQPYTIYNVFLRYCSKMMYGIHFINRWQKWQFYRMRRRRALYKNIKHRSFEMCLKTKLSKIQVFVNMLINKTRWLLLLTSNTSFAVKLVLKTKRVKRRMVGVIDQDVHADLCHCDVCLARQRNFRDKYSPAKTSDNHATVKK